MSYLINKAKKKNWIVDEYKDGTIRIRNCTRNVANMNVFDYSLCYYLHWNGIKYGLFDIIEYFKQMFVYMFYVVVNIISIPFLPIIAPIYSIKKIKEAKKEMEKYNKKAE